MKVHHPDITPIVVGIDPGNRISAGVVIQGDKILDKCRAENADFLEWLNGWQMAASAVVCEMIASYGMAVGESVFETCCFIGRIQERTPGLLRVTRMSVKTTLCNSAKAKDANVRQRLLDIWGPAGTNKSPGPTYGVTKDLWAALAVATAYRMGCKLYTPKT